MCIRDSRLKASIVNVVGWLARMAADFDAGALPAVNAFATTCLLYTSDAADERSSVDLGGSRIIKKKKPDK